MKQKITLFAVDGTTLGTAEIEVDEFFALSGAVVWKSRYFKVSFQYGPEPDPLPLVEEPAIILPDDAVVSS